MSKETFPFSSVSDSELLETIHNFNEDLEELYNYCINLNHNLRSDYDQFTDDVDPDTNVLNIIKSEYYMTEKVNTKTITKMLKQI